MTLRALKIEAKSKLLCIKEHYQQNRKPQNGRKTVVNHLPDKGLITTILKKSNSNMGKRTWEYISPKKICKWSTSTDHCTR